MGTKRHYKPGSFYRICDRTGFAVRAEDTQMEWNNLIVDKRVWEVRQPQDFVKGIPDNQTVPYARPRSPNLASGATISAEFEVLGDLPGRVMFNVLNSSMPTVSHSNIVVRASDYPASA